MAPNTWPRITPLRTDIRSRETLNWNTGIFSLWGLWLAKIRSGHKSPPLALRRPVTPRYFALRSAQRLEAPAAPAAAHERLQGGVVAYNTDVRERPAQLATRSLPCEACSGNLTCWTAQAQAWLIPEPDAGLVQVQSQDRAARWHLALQEMEPLPHSCCLDEQKMNKKGSVLAHPSLTQNNHTAPKRGPLCGPKNPTEENHHH